MNVKGTRQERTKGPFLAILSDATVFLHSSHPNVAPEPLLRSTAADPRVCEGALTHILFKARAWLSSYRLAVSGGYIFRFSPVRKAVGLSFHSSALQFSALDIKALHKIQVLLSPRCVF